MVVAWHELVTHTETYNSGFYIWHDHHFYPGTLIHGSDRRFLFSQAPLQTELLDLCQTIQAAYVTHEPQSTSLIQNLMGAIMTRVAARYIGLIECCHGVAVMSRNKIMCGLFQLFSIPCLRFVALWWVRIRSSILTSIPSMSANSVLKVTYPVQ